MSSLTVTGGRLRVNGCGGALVLSPKSNGSPCCCGCQAEDITFPCSITVIHVDENRCEDDVFNVYVVGAAGERFIRELDLVSDPPGCCNSGCPQTRIEFDITLNSDDFTTECYTTVEARLVRLNCCATLTRLTLIAANGQELVGTYFGQEGYTQTFTAEQLCGDGAGADPP